MINRSFVSFVSRMPTLRGRFLRLTLIIAAVSLLLSMIGTLVILRYGLNKTINSQLDELADGMLAQLSPSVVQSSSSGTLPVLLTLFDDRNLFRVLRVETLEGAVLYASEAHLEIMDRFFEKRKELDAEDESADRLLTLWHTGRSWRMGWYQDEGVRILLAADLAQIDRSLMRVGWAFLLVLPVAFGTAIVASRLLALRATDSIADLAKRAGEITVERLNERIDIPAGTREIRDLIDLFNAMVDRLGKSFQMTRRFSADASHELKSPLTVMQGILESHISGENPSSISTEEMDALLSETQRMRAIIEALLLLSRADEGRLINHW
ncbi:MAG TPA: histidine kinase dimerization/phospho-acceptor domain-containing protein, partial [Opitutales bacterium]|nr:histidine kinase dimerization/phospho-acceptor domain-containing protein [Opitutales bacterium]